VVAAGASAGVGAALATPTGSASAAGSAAGTGNATEAVTGTASVFGEADGVATATATVTITRTFGLFTSAPPGVLDAIFAASSSGATVADRQTTATFTSSSSTAIIADNFGTSAIMATTFQIVAGDLLPVIQATLIGPNGVLDLTGATIVFRMKPPSGSAVNLSATIMGSPVNGVVQYAWQGSDTAVAGLYSAEWVVTIGGKPMTIPSDQPFQILIRAQI
jgi:hypothetical protein